MTKEFDIESFRLRLLEMHNRAGSLAQFVRQSFDGIEHALTSGVSQSEIVRLFHEFNVPMTLSALKAGLRREREQRGLVGSGGRYKRPSPVRPVPASTWQTSSGHVGYGTAVPVPYGAAPPPPWSAISPMVDSSNIGFPPRRFTS